MSLLIVNTVMMLIAGLGCLVVGALILNDVPLNAAPGFAVRIVTYLTSNLAETRRGHPFRELELPVYRLVPDTLLARVEHAAEQLGWKIVDIDTEQHTVNATVETRLLRFVNDVHIQLVIGDQGTEAHIRSSSRIGRGDLGANSRHILDLKQMLARQV